MICVCENARYTLCLLLLFRKTKRNNQRYARNEHNDAYTAFMFTHLHSMILEYCSRLVCQNKFLLICIHTQFNSIEFWIAFVMKKRCVFVRQHIKYHFILLCLNLIRVFYSFRSFIMWFNFDIIPILIIHLYISFRQKKKTLLIRLFNDKYVKFDERHKMYAQNGWMFFRKQTVSLVKTSKQTNELETKNFSLNLDCHQLPHTHV